MTLNLVIWTGKEDLSLLKVALTEQDFPAIYKNLQRMSASSSFSMYRNSLLKLK